MAPKPKTGEQFLHERDHNFHKSREVEDVTVYLRRAGEKIPNEPSAKIKNYLGFLANKEYVNDGILTGGEDSINRQIDAHVIAAKDVPESYFELQQRIAREQGHGYIDITPEMRRQLIESVQADQRAGLNNWVEYLGGDDGSYPDWFKHYTFESVVRLGVYDKEKQQFGKRSNGTTAPYPELNREALAYVYDALVKTRVKGEPVDDEKLTALLQSANFGKLYAHGVREITPDDPELRNTIVGSWTKYDQTSDPRTARRLSDSLTGHGTGWCTAGESTAALQLQGGDFYVYYTRDNKNKDTIPRVAIRMENGRVAEVRGVNADQNLEGEVADIVMERLRELPGGPEYQKKANDMKRLTEIEKLISANPDTKLSSADIKFLYEMTDDIQGFGYQRDPRIDAIKQKRGERDMGEIKPLLIEVIHEQAASAYASYSEVASELGDKLVSKADFAVLLQEKTAEWKRNGTYDYIAREFMAGGGRPNLVVTPNVLADWKQLRQVAEKLGKDQLHGPYIDEELYSQYSARELSGAPTNDELRFSLIPSRNTPRLGQKPADEQLGILKQMQSEQPGLNLKVPSVLDAITYWQTQRSCGDALANETTFDKIYIRHFDLPAKRLDDWSYVPDSYVSGDGEPYLYLDSSYVDYGDDARVSVG